MILGFQLNALIIIYAGIFTFALLVFQMLVGLRKIKFKGRMHMRVHKWGAWALVVAAALHGFMGMVLYNGWRIG